jgi:glycosyltransferase involved in cell wall biosynthesis
LAGTEERKRRTLAAIPCYNEEHTIGSTVLKAKRFVDEVLVIDDGSSDATATVAEYAGAIVVKNGKNKGYGSAIQRCFEYARKHQFEAMTLLDGDGQHDATAIKSVMKPVLDGKTDIAIGSRFVNGNGKNVPLHRRMGISLLTGLTNANAKKHNRVTDGQSGFRAFSKKAIQILNPKDPNMGASAEILLQGNKLGLKYLEVPIDCRYDIEGSTFNPVGHGLGVIVSIFKYIEVEHPLLFFGVPALLFSGLGLLMGAHAYGLYKQSGYLSFGPALITVALLILGMLAGMTGIILHAVISANRRV